MTLNDVKPVASKTLQGFQEHRIMVQSAAAAYYALFALAPMLVIATAVAGFFWGDQPEDAQDEIVSELEGAVGPEVAGMLETMLENAAASPGSGVLATLVGIGVLLYTAGALFAHIQDSLNIIWGVRPVGGIKSLLRVRLKAVGVMVGAGLLFVAITVASALISGFADMMAGIGPWLPALARILSLVVAISLFTLLIAAIFSVLPDANIAWRDVLWGAAFTAVLLALGTWAIGWYLGESAPGSAYGAAGALMALMIWIFYTTVIFFVGAEFTRVHMEQTGRSMQPASYAEHADRRSG